MKKLKIILKYSYIIIIIFTFFYIKNYISNNKYHSKYSLDNNYIEGYIKDIKIKDNKLTIIIDDVIINFYDDEIPQDLIIGDYVRVYGDLIIPNKNTTPYLFNYRFYLYSINIHYILKPDKYIKINKKTPIIYYLKRKLITYFSNYKSNNYLLTFILGNNYAINQEIINSYNKNGISHLFAISGMHVSLLTGILLFILLKIMNEKKSYIICSLFLIFYLFLTCFSKSIVRAAFLFFFITFKKIFKIKLDIKKVYLIFTCFILYLNPYNIFNNAFLYSYIISYFLICYGNIINKYHNYFLKILATSLIAFIVGIPISINASFELNLISPFLNIFFVPIISLIIFPLTLLTALIPFLDVFTTNIITIIEKISLICSKITIFKINMPYLDIYLIIIYYLLIIFVLHKIRKNKYHYIFIIIIFLAFNYYINYFRNYNTLTMIDVSQGDSILINYAHNKGAILIDTGGKVNSDYSYTLNITIPYLKALGIHKLDYLVLTHGDFDHMGNAIDLVNNFKVNNVIFNCAKYNYLEKELIKVLETKNINYYSCIDKINISNNILYFLNTKDFNNENDNSNVIYTKIDNYKILLMGDASITTEKEIMDSYNLPTIDILKVGHHGSRTSSSKEFIDKINPTYSLISVGKDNKFKHPNQEVLDILVNSKIYRTDQNGSITFKINNDKIIIN